VGGRIPAHQSGGDNAAIGQSDVNVFVAAKRMLSGDDDAAAPHNSARRTAGLRVNGDCARRGAIGSLRQGVRKRNQFCGHFRDLHEQDAARGEASTSAKWLGTEPQERAGIAGVLEDAAAFSQSWLSTKPMK